VAAHPDDETLGLGGTLAQLAARGVEVSVVSVTDGGAADVAGTDQRRLEQQRRTELDCAAEVLGVNRVTRLGLPDGAVADHEDRLTDLLVDVLAGGQVWCAATWRGDGHPDHEAVGRAAAVAAQRAGVTFVEYPVWMWHWAMPADPDVPWDQAVAVPLDRAALACKERAAQCFRSQFEGVDPVLPHFVLPRLLAVGEVLFR
jgi:LmbE family N-acetylglucosaminyl deacetylase